MKGVDRVVEPNAIPAGGDASAASGSVRRETVEGAASVLRAGVVLCVDLDGTLVKSDTLLDTVLVVARQRQRFPLGKVKRK